MKLAFRKGPVILFAAVLSLGLAAQKTASYSKVQRNPENFVISHTAIAELLRMKEGEKVNMPANGYINKSQVVKKTATGDMQYLRLKLNYFRTGWLSIQVNGEFTTQIFLMTDDKSVFYKGKKEKDGYRMVKCKEYEIYQE
jgi:hypothetical protein